MEWGTDVVAVIANRSISKLVGPIFYNNNLFGGAFLRGGASPQMACIHIYLLNFNFLVHAESLFTFQQAFLKPLAYIDLSWF